MNSFLLLDDVRCYLEAQLADWRLRQGSITGGRFSEQDERYAVPKVMIGQLPPRSGSRPAGGADGDETDPDTPFILVRPIDGVLDGNRPADYEINLAIVCGIYSHESREHYAAGVQDVMNLCDRLLQIIGGRQLWAANHFKQTRTLRWTIGAPRALGPYDAGLQELGPVFHMVIDAPFERTLNLPDIPLMSPNAGGTAQAGSL